MKKKIGCVIAYRKGQNNYGTSLQGYAMIRKIRQMGYEVEVINYIKNFSLWDKVKWTINAYRCGMLRKDSEISIPAEIKRDYTNNLRIRTEAVDNYKKANLLPFFHDYSGYSALHEGSKNYDAIVVGSDQVWLPQGLTTNFFNLLFADDSVRKVSYASSFGVSEIPSFQRKKTGKYLNRFYAISVRENRGKEIVEVLSNKKATVVADPTLLLTRDEWETEIENTKPRSDKSYIFSYLISENEEARRYVAEFAEKKRLKLICIRHLEKFRIIDESYGDEAPYDVDPNDFLRLIHDAAYVCTDSFHCTVFSHIFHKQFLTFYRTSTGKTSRNSRIDSLFAVLGTNPSHLFVNGGMEGIDSPINWEDVDGNLSNLREASEVFLINALS